LQGETFQVVSPLHGAAGYPDRVMLASLDPGVPLEWRMQGLSGDQDVELVVPVRLVQAAGPFNLLDNAGFERGTVGWTQGGTLASAGTVPSGPVEGTASLKLTFDGSSTYAEMVQVVTGATPGRYYTLSGYLWRETNVGTVTLVASEAGVPMPGGTAAMLGPGSSVAWVRYQAAFRLPDTSGGTIAIECMGLGVPSGAAWFDALALEAQVPASEYRERGT
jgi:hypothetical protein